MHGHVQEAEQVARVQRALPAPAAEEVSRRALMGVSAARPSSAGMSQEAWAWLRYSGGLQGDLFWGKV